MLIKNLRLANCNFDVTCEVENCCPHCGIYNEPTVVSDLNNITKNQSIKIFATIFKTTCCSKIFVSFYLYNEYQRTTKLLFTYPNIKTVVLPEEIRKISPDFVKLFNQAKTVSDLGLEELACIGYRTAIEFLLKDFLINLKKYDEKQISKMKLIEVISLFQEKEISISADVVRIFGNDKTHYISKYDFSIKQVELYLSFLLDSIRKEYLLLNPPVFRK